MILSDVALSYGLGAHEGQPLFCGDRTLLIVFNSPNPPSFFFSFTEHSFQLSEHLTPSWKMPQNPDSHSEMPYVVESFSYTNNLVKVFTFYNSNYTFEEEPQMGELMGNQPASPKIYLTSFQGASPLSSRMDFSLAVYKFYNSGTPGPRDHVTFTWIIPSGLRAPLPALSCNHCCFCVPNQGVGLGIICLTTLGNLISFTKQLSELPLITWIFHVFG